MPRLYTEKKHAQALNELREEYDGRLKELQAALVELKEENRRLSAEISLLTAQKQSISDAIIAASEKRKEMQGELNAFIEAQKALAVQAAEKAQALLCDVRAAYPDEADSLRFSAFERRLRALLSPGEESSEEGNADPGAFETDGEGGGLAFSAAEPSETADGEWDLQEVLKALGLSDD